MLIVPPIEQVHWWTNSNVWLVIVGVVTACVIGWQSWETRKSAKAMRDSIGLQEAAMQQWVDVNPLSYEIKAASHGAGATPFTVHLSFEAVNNTSQPFDVLKIVTKIGTWANEWEVSTVEENVTLVPQNESRSKRYYFYASTERITEDWLRMGTDVTINGWVTFKNCLGKVQTDYFGGLYRCKAGAFRYLRPLGVVPERTTESELQIPD